METKSVKVATIHERIVAIAKEVTPITKERINQGQSYKFRGIDDVMNALQPLFAKHGVYLTAAVLDDKTEERTSKSGAAMTFRTIRMRYSLCCEDGSSIMTESLGEGCDSGDKSAAKSMSIALKYALLQLLMIPTEEPKDPENDNHEVEPKPKVAPRAVEMIAADQRIVIKKLIDDKQEAGEDVEAVIGKVCDYYGIKTFPADLTKTQADEVIKRWSKKAKS